ncbi:hypothetical protein Afer_1279 [Acidimicrobium ferrooxidans DSM 10331]|uniref:Type II secretion system protein n=1 Tax=Acidimicrobium ferrooxidans (strain DSM 10331 / JCM 15462 / NBRC 103882 / ICP) TaxID=525909 RepID=C7LZQ2_ACIFD|nr:hypothetical protein [Acidimicrobium ferrooxidans]ACU54210.1 hypothetical protein Afer_1279 [Acidimicrobium ferrooxidans DSM 10331]
MSSLIGLGGVALLLASAWLATTVREIVPARLLRHLELPPPSRPVARWVARRSDDWLLATGVQPATDLARFADPALGASGLVGAVGIVGHSAPAVSGALMAPVVVVALRVAMVMATARRVRERLRATWSSELGEIRHLVAAGASLPGALTTRRDADTPWSTQWHGALAEMGEGTDLEVALAHVAERLRDANVGAALRLLGSSWAVGAVTPALGELERDALARRRADALRLASRREQLVWIPVAVSALVPGVTLVVVPLAAGLQKLVGL